MQNHQDLIKLLSECARVCQMCASACLSESNVSMMARCIKTDLDCAEICMVTANCLQGDSEIADSMLDVCADMCRMCAEECEKHASMMDHCRICAEICRRCEEACQVNV